MVGETGESDAGSAWGRALSRGEPLVLSDAEIAACQAVCRLAVPLAADSASVYTFDGAMLLRRANFSSDAVRERARGQQLDNRLIDPAGDNCIAEVFRSGSRLEADRLTADEVLRLFGPGELSEVILGLGVRAVLVMPLDAGGGAAGVLVLSVSQGREAFSNAERALADELVRAASTALDNAVLAAERRTSLAVLDSVLESAPVGLGFFDRELRYVRVNVALAEINGMAGPEHEGRTIGELLGPAIPDTVSRDIAAVFRTGEPLVDRDVRGATPASPGRLRHWLVSYFPVQVTPAEPVRFVGAVLVEITERKEAELERASLLQAAEAARSAAERAQARAEQAQGRLATLAEASRLFTGALDIAAILGNLVRLVVPSLGDWAVADVLDDTGALVRVASMHADPRRVPALDQLGVPSHVTRDNLLLQQEHAGLLRELGGSDEEYDRYQALGAASVIVVPLRARGTSIGQLQVATTGDADRLLTHDDLVLVADVASRAALAVDTARLFEREHKVAVTLQHSLLPARLPDVPGVDRAVRYVAGGLEQEVGGDWYDVVCSPDGRVAFTIGDVVGHDVVAASVMGQLRNAVRVYASEGHEPGAVISRLNRLVDTLGLDHMATMVHALLDPVTGELRYTNAGHPLPLLLRADGSTEWLDGPGSLPVGAVPEPVWAEASAELGHGDTIVLYTDGLVEDRRRPIDDGMADLRVAVAEAAGRDANGLCDHLLDELLSGEARGDDVALLVFRWTG